MVFFITPGFLDFARQQAPGFARNEMRGYAVSECRSRGQKKSGGEPPPSKRTL
jgi:hypothetical protein